MSTELAQISLFDGDCTVYAKNEGNRRRGHLRIDCGTSTYVFLTTSPYWIDFGHMSGETGRLDAAQLREIGDYCHDMATRIEQRQEAS